MRSFSLKVLSESYQSRHEPEKYIAASEIIWVLMLSAASIAIVASVGYGIWQFVAPPEVVTTEAATGGITGFNHAQLTQVVDFYEKRQAIFEDMMSGE